MTAEELLMVSLDGRLWQHAAIEHCGQGRRNAVVEK
jgi:hypothetical protein